VDRVVQEVAPNLVGLPGQLGDHACEVVEVLGRARREASHLGDGHADVEDLQADELVGVLANRGCDATQDGGALGALQRWPGTVVERRTRGTDREVDIGGEAFGHVRDRLVGRRIERLECPPVEPGTELARDVVQLRPDADRVGGERRAVGCLRHRAIRPAKPRAGQLRQE
jgi:hypothetical protein